MLENGYDEAQFEIYLKAKEIAFISEKNTMRRASGSVDDFSYYGANLDGIPVVMWEEEFANRSMWDEDYKIVMNGKVWCCKQIGSRK
jgi:hypothetical protein